MQIRRMGPQIGVEVSDVDVRALDDAGFATIYQAWLDHNVLVVTGQELTIPEFLRYSWRFGHVTPHPSKSTRHPLFRLVPVLSAAVIVCLGLALTGASLGWLPRGFGG